MSISLFFHPLLCFGGCSHIFKLWWTSGGKYVEEIAAELDFCYPLVIDEGLLFCSSVANLIVVVVVIQSGRAGGQGVPDGPTGVCQKPAQPAD